jgi:hypothetical protein
MTAITHHGTDRVRRSALRELVRLTAGRLATLAHWLKLEVVEIATADRLGRDEETEIGRWTGARV